MGTIVVVLMIACAAGLAVRSLIKDRRKGIYSHCGGNCQNCLGHCDLTDQDHK